MVSDYACHLGDVGDRGLEIIAPDLDTWVVPISIIVLTLLFAIQKHGTSMVASCSRQLC